MLPKHFTVVLFLMATLFGLTVANGGKPKKPQDPSKDPNCGAPFCGNKAEQDQGEVLHQVMANDAEEPEYDEGQD